MTRRLLSFLTAACVLAGGSGAGLAQSALPLRGSVDEAPAGETTQPNVPPVTSTPLRETRLEIAPVQAEEQPRRPAQPELDPYAPTGIGTGGLRLYPSITIGTVYSTNVNESPTKPQDDSGLLLRPRLRLESDWVRHAYQASIDGDLIYYRDNDEYDAKTITAEHSLRLDIRRFTTATLDARYVLDMPKEGDPEEQTLSGGVALSQDFGPVVATLRGGLLSKTFGDTKVAGGGSVSNDDLDYLEPSLSVRGAFRLSEMLRPYVEASYTPRLHNEKPDRNGFNRDSDEYEFGAGVEVVSGPIWTGELGLTYLHRNYQDSGLNSANALGLSGELTWSPSDLTSIVMSASTEIDEVASGTDPGQPVYNFRTELTHALRDNIDVTAGFGIEIEDSGKQTDRTYDAGVGLAWKLNPVLSWTAGYDFTWLDSGAKNGDYTEHRLSTGLTVSR